jgi:predicted nucleotidyltransferase
VNLSQPLLDVVPGVRGQLLYALARSEVPVTRRRLAGMAGVAPGNANSILDDLVHSGLCNETAAGRSLMVSLNRKNLAAEQVLALTALRATLINRLRAELKRWKGLKAAWLFGSVARSDSNEDSDIDIAMVFVDPESEVSTRNISELQVLLREWTGNEVQIAEYSEAAWARLVLTQNPLVGQIRKDGIALTSSSTSLLTARR